MRNVLILTRKTLDQVADEATKMKPDFLNDWNIFVTLAVQVASSTIYVVYECTK